MPAYKSSSTSKRLAMNNILLSAFILLTGALPARALSVLDSKHNLAADSATSGPKAVNELLTCMFCHTMHKPAQMTALWNRVAPRRLHLLLLELSEQLPGHKADDERPTRPNEALPVLPHGVTALGSVFSVAPNTLEMTGGSRRPRSSAPTRQRPPGALRRQPGVARLPSPEPTPRSSFLRPATR